MTNLPFTPGPHDIAIEAALVRLSLRRWQRVTGPTHIHRALACAARNGR